MRILVTGKYLNNSTYVLYNQDGTEYMKLTEGESFYIGKDKWTVERKSIEKSTILVCVKYGKNKKREREYKLFNNNKILWALTLDAIIEGGLYKPYIQPRSRFEEQVEELGELDKIVRMREIKDIVLLLGRNKNSHEKYKYATDASIRVVASNGELYDGWFNGGTYLIAYKQCYKSRRRIVEQIFITPEADASVVINALKRIKALR